MRLLLIRHGATPLNEQKRYIGRTDEGLSENGIAGILSRKEEGKYPRADLIAASPMRRCVETAQLIYGTPKMVRIEEWREIDFGRFEGESYRTLKGCVEYQRWIDSGGMLPFPEGESRKDFLDRCINGFLKFCVLLKEKGFTEEGGSKTAALIVHGGTIMSILSAYSEGDYYDYQCGNAEGYSCVLHLKNKIRLEQIEKL